MDIFVFDAQFALSLIVCGLLAKWFVAPWLRGMPRQRAILILLAPQAFRHLGMYALVQAAFNPQIPQSWANSTGYGDLATQLTSMLAMVMLHRESPLGIPCAWLCNVAGSVIFLVTSYQTQATVPLHLLNAGWFLPVFFLPVIVWAHFYAFRFLLAPKK